MNRGVLLRSRESAARVFGYIQPNENVGAVPSDPIRYLLVDMESDPVAMLATGITSLAHTHTCSSIMSAGAQANLSIPVGDLKAGLTADYSNKVQTVLALVEGTFFSPISSMLNLGNQNDQTFARLLFWEWYSRNPNALASPQYFVKQFDGFTLYEFTKERRDLNGKVDFSGGYAVPGIASIKAMIQAGVLTSDATDVKAFATGFYVDPNGNSPQVQTQAVPAPSILAADLSKVRPVVTVDNPLVLQNKPNTHTVEVQGMPPALCSLSAWGIDPQPAAGTLSLASAAELESNKVCRFAVSLVARPDVFTPANANLALQYAIVSAGTIAGQQVRFSVNQINLTTSSSPVVALGQVNPSWSVRQTIQNGNTLTDLKWQVPIVVDDRQNPLQPGGVVSVSRASLSCEQGDVVVTTDPTLTLAADHTTTLTVTHSVFAPEEFDEKNSPIRDCRFNATLDLPLQTGGAATRSIPTARLLYPPKKQPPPTPGEQTLVKPPHA
jgi:hypothetical protein